MQSVRSYVESAFVPGRVIILPATLPGERAAEHVLLDREMRRCDSQGVAVIEQAPVLPRAVAHLRLGDDSTIHTWRRLELPQPFYINVWWVPRNG